MVYFCFLSIIGFFINIWLYIDDIKNRGGVLDKVDTGEGDGGQANPVNDFVASPTQAQRRQNKQDLENLKSKDGGMTADEEVKAALLEYRADKSNRDSLRRSMGVAAAK